MEEHRLKKIGDSKWLLIPYEFIKVHELDKYIWHLEVSKDGKQILFSRMRKDETIKEKEE